MNSVDESTPHLSPVFCGSLTLQQFFTVGLHESADSEAQQFFHSNINSGVIVYPDETRAEKHRPGAFLDEGQDYYFRDLSQPRGGICKSVKITEIPLQNGVTLIRRCTIINTGMGEFPDRVYYVK